MLIQLAAAIVLLQALLLAGGLLMMLVSDEGGPGRRAFDTTWPLSGLLMLACLVVWTYAGFALLRPRLFGAEVPGWVAVLNVLSVAAVALGGAWSLFTNVQHYPASLPGSVLSGFGCIGASRPWRRACRLVLVAGARRW